ncbi:MAG: ATP-binding protein, partial [SAR324 cluster bacterium]|nr:ATP-binding protein [SAR324 cluster bacterium]
MDRSISKQIKEDLKEKMVFIGGPRQVGKTTLAINFLPSKSKSDPAYLTWDQKSDRLLIQKEQLPAIYSLIVLDEIHKYRSWRNLVKGYFDRYFPKVNYLITGSARLDVYRHGGDSLHGRYYYHRLHPLSLKELNNNPTSADLAHLFKYGGFPEPFLKATERFLARWRRSRIESVFQEDIRELESVKDLSRLELLFETLPDRLCSPLSLNAIAKDLEVSRDSVALWIEIFDRMYLTFRISPYGGPKIRAVKKEQKLYFWDWTIANKDGPRFENLVALQLLKYC